MQKTTEQSYSIRLHPELKTAYKNYDDLHSQLAPYFASICDPSCGFVCGKPVFIKRTYDGRQMELFT